MMIFDQPEVAEVMSPSSQINIVSDHIDSSETDDRQRFLD
jgi:hypothetical protein